MSRKLPQAFFDMVRQPQAVLLMEPFALLFAECLSFFFPTPQLCGAVPSLNRSLKSLVEIHRRRSEERSKVQLMITLIPDAQS